MDFSSYPWMAGSFNIGGPTTSYLDPTLTGQQPNIYAPASNPYAGAAPLSGGATQSGWAALLSNPQFMRGLASLAGAGQQQQVQPPMIRAPDPQTFDGRQYMPYLLSRAARGRVR